MMFQIKIYMWETRVFVQGGQVALGPGLPEGARAGQAAH